MKIPKKGINVPRRVREKLGGEWQIILQAPVGHVFEDRMIGIMRFRIQRGPASLCTYVGLPLDHPLAGRKYGDLDIPCHGGLTFSQAGNGRLWPADRWWYGWDYGHMGDYMTYYDYPPLAGKFTHPTDYKWTPAMVADDAEDALQEFERLVKNG